MSKSPRLTHGLAVLCGLMCAGLFVGSMYLLANWGKRGPPQPDGMILRIALREGGGIFDRFTVEPVPGPTPMIAVEIAPFRQFYGYPDGVLIRTEPLSSRRPADASLSASFDFDGDGAIDVIHAEPGGTKGLIRVTSGAGGRVLFEDLEELVYEDNDRAFPLGDLDGDGRCELGLVHPRYDRSTYDFEPLDSLFGMRSWVTVVSSVPSSP